MILPTKNYCPTLDSIKKGTRGSILDIKKEEMLISKIYRL